MKRLLLTLFLLSHCTLLLHCGVLTVSNTTPTSCTLRVVYPGITEKYYFSPPYSVTTHVLPSTAPTEENSEVTIKTNNPGAIYRNSERYQMGVFSAKNTEGNITILAIDEGEDYPDYIPVWEGYLQEDDSFLHVDRATALSIFLKGFFLGAAFEIFGLLFRTFKKTTREALE